MKPVDLKLFSEYLSYNKNTGLFHWIKSPSRRAKEGARAGCLNNSGYIVIRLKNELFYAHRVAYALVYGEIKNYIDHINRDKQDNRIKNLRDVKMAENNVNRKLSSNNSTAKTGTSYSRLHKKYVAYIDYAGKRITLGYRKSLTSAVALRRAAELKFYGKELPS